MLLRYVICLHRMTEVDIPVFVREAEGLAQDQLLRLPRDCHLYLQTTQKTS